MNNYLYFVVKAFRKQGTNRTVNEARCQRFLLGRLAFTLEKTAGNTSGGVSFFNVIHRQRKKVLAGLGALGTYDSRQNDRILDTDKNRAAGLTRNFSGFQSDRVLSILK